uniref:Uncharacterized protein n=1 Tax=Candidatus Berkiella cookevillensis TaxID=437022 RepID=A0A0Q9YLN6_9GAMM
MDPIKLSWILANSKQKCDSQKMLYIQVLGEQERAKETAA